jgi:hypothetical protein
MRIRNPGFMSPRFENWETICLCSSTQGVRAYLGHAVERVDGEHESLALDHSSLFFSIMGLKARVLYYQFL